MSTVPLLHEADANQARAADPEASAWVSANAGTGKTAVLVKRTLRLLLAGSKPEAILCLTYTKNAAAEMQNRLLGVLADWATIPSEALHTQLVDLLGRAPEAAELRVAKRLFAKALEARGGLKIHTIHGFCERLLQRFPLEAQITPHFKVLDEHGAARLKQQAYEATIARAAEGRDSALGRALAKAITYTSDDYFRKVVETVLAKRGELARMLAYHESADDWAEAESQALKRLFDVAEEEEESLIAALAGVLSDAEIDAAIAAFAAFGGTAKTDKDAERSLHEARASSGEARMTALKPLFLTGDGDARKQTCNKAFANDAPDIAALLDDAKSRYAALSEKLARLRVAEASGAVLAFADAIHDDYERRKRAEAVLDYDDLIAKARNLFLQTGAASWVLYKIDGGIDHILVDEAQDTNPAQWEIVQSVAEEFFSGADASGKLRTLFAVGDEKQSIYSFQGADPARFGDVGRAFRLRAAAIEVPWHDVPLNLSFRSTMPVLEAVDAVFARPQAAQGLTFAETIIIQHHAHRQGQAGLVELWQLESETKPDPVEAFEPWNEAVIGARAVDTLCRRIAAQIKRWLDEGEPLPARGRKVRPGDILILVRRRDPFTTPMIRALKRLGINVAGADRMKLTDQLAVQDLVALADVLLMPEDDLALAVVLKSPLFNLDDAALFDVAYRRQGSLWSALKAKAKEDVRFAEAEQRLTAWLDLTDFLPPYEFFAEVLGAGGQLMRKRLLTRLGPEAAEAIDEFLDSALGYDREDAPSLQGFIDRLRADEVEIKRDMDQDRDEVRIMTVHGAKGLEAPIVFLPDTCMTPRPQGPRIFPLPRAGEPPDEVPHLAWAPAGHSDLGVLAESKAALSQAEREEHNRLLYVAMTRASDRLYVCGWQGLRKREENCWYDLVNDGLAGHFTEIAGADGVTVRRMESTQEKSVESSEAKSKLAEAAPLPGWALKPATPERTRPRFAPSRLALKDSTIEQPPLGPLALGDRHRFARGRLVHALLQHLPEVKPENQEKAARAFVTARGAGLPEDLKDDILAETLAIVRDTRFAPLFQPGSLAEVPVVAEIGEGENAFEVEGQIDRLAILDGELTILDYKTNRPPPERPEDVAPAYIAQLAAYRAALGKLFPGRAIRAALLWTDGPKLMEIPETMLDAAECRLLPGEP
ncbi:MAG TPA: double-strand break repair helicase AddA [Methyloceanibacter sp.]|nr:double-strand break repair helicase AddA [Methyloceanibacter sp.]